jgi:hypothetical protein
MPSNPEQARRHSDSGWWEAAEAEMDGHIKKGTYEVIDWTALPPGRRPIRTMMIFDIKRSGKKKARWFCEATFKSMVWIINILRALP